MEIRHIECPVNKVGLKCPFKMKPTRIVIHNTANDATAENEIKYMHKNNMEKSFHFAVDDKEVIQGIALDRNAWHAGDGNGKGNREGIAIEICYSKSGGEKFLRAVKKAAELTAFILKNYGWGIEHVTKHKDYNGKNCPHRILDEYGWENFLKLVKEFLYEPEKQAPIDVFYRAKVSGKWLPQVNNLEDYAGIKGKAITDIAVGVLKGSIKYRVHTLKGKWLPYVTRYNINDAINGYAGNGKPIDAIEVIYYPAKNAVGKKAVYRVSPIKKGYFSWQKNNEKDKTQDGYAGLFGKKIDRFQIEIV